MKIIFFLITASIFISTIGNALEAGPYRVAGKITSFNDRVVIINTGVSIIEIPRKFIYENHLKRDLMINITLLESDKKLLVIKDLPKSSK